MLTQISPFLFLFSWHEPQNYFYIHAFNLTSRKRDNELTMSQRQQPSLNVTVVTDGMLDKPFPLFQEILEETKSL